MRFLFSIVILAILCIGCAKKDSPQPSTQPYSNGTNWKIESAWNNNINGLDFTGDSLQNGYVYGQISYLFSNGTTYGFKSDFSVSIPPKGFQSGVYPIDSIPFNVWIFENNSSYGEGFFIPNLPDHPRPIQFVTVTNDGVNITLNVTNVSLYVHTILVTSTTLYSDSITLSGTFIKHL